MRYLAVLSILCSFVFCAYEESLFEEYSTTLRTVNKNRATIDDSPLIVVGSSGIVIRKFDNSQETIIAYATVIAKDGISALVELKPYDTLSQNTFPKLAIIPKNGDEIRLNYLYNRSLIIAPTSESHRKIINFFTKINWVHPDIAAAYLAKEHIPKPDKNDFSKICKLNSTGLILFNIKHKGFFVDCISFNIVKTFTLNNADLEQNATLPFYSRISDNIKSSPLKIMDKRVEDYDAYYKILLDLE